MNDPFDPPRIVNQSQSRHAAEWGLAALLMGGILAIMSLLMLMVNVLLYMGALDRPFLGSGEVRAVFIGAIFGAVILAGLCGTSIAFGIRSIVSAYRREQPCALGWAGLLISILAMLLWIAVMVDLFMIVTMMMRFDRAFPRF